MKSLDYAYAEYFSTDEIRFLLQISSSYKTLTDEEIEAEHEQIQRDMESDEIFSTHGEYLLKAVHYWKIHFKESFEQWRHEFVEAKKERIQRILASVDVTPGTDCDG